MTRRCCSAGPTSPGTTACDQGPRGSLTISTMARGWAPDRSRPAELSGGCAAQGDRLTRRMLRLLRLSRRANRDHRYRPALFLSGVRCSTCCECPFRTRAGTHACATIDLSRPLLPSPMEGRPAVGTIEKSSERQYTIAGWSIPVLLVSGSGDVQHHQLAMTAAPLRSPCHGSPLSAPSGAIAFNRRTAGSGANPVPQ